MTTLAITPNWKNKTAKFKGTVAAGEHVSVTIQNDNGEGEPFIDDTSTLRLRVVDPCNGRTLAIFPEPVPEGETPEEWDSDLSPLRCTLNLNTVQMLKAVPSAANVPLLFVLDDYENKTLYFKEQFPVEHWPRLRGEEEPTDLDNYKDLIAEFNARLDGFGSRITAAENAAQAATENASAAAGKANQAVDTANQAVDKAETAQNSAAASAEAAHDSALAAEKAQELAEAAAESINNPDATLAQEGVAADAKATGERIAAERTRAEAAEAAEESRAKAAESVLAANVSSAQKAISDEAELRAAADADLEANKADKTAVDAETSRAQAAEQVLRAEVSSAQTAIANRYTKSEVDAKIAAVQTFQKYLVQTLPDPEAADYKGLYLVPTGETSPEGDLCEEWTVVGEVGSRRWEKIGGGTAVDVTLDDTVTRTSAKGVKSSGIWAAIWGALAALPSGVASLYDWCVAQLAGKVNRSGDTMTGGLTVPNLTVGSRESGSIVGPNSVAEGTGVTARTNSSHAEGFYTVASGACSHAEGSYTEASGTNSHAEGDSNMASGADSHTEGSGTMARNAYEHAQGHFNASHTGAAEADNTLSSIGFGINDGIRKNAVETMRDGKTYIYGLGGYDGTNPGAAQDLAQSVNGKAAAADLRYALVTPEITTTYSVPDSWFPITFEEDGTSYTVPLADKGKITLFVQNGAAYLEYDDDQGIIVLAFFLSGTLDSILPDVSPSLQFAGVAPVIGETALDATATATLADRACNAVTGVTGAASLTLPAAVQGRVRDLTVRLTLTTTTSISFVPITGETIAWDSSGDPSGTFQAGTHLLRLTEVAPGVFHVGGIAAGNLITIVTLSDSTETMAAILARLNAINAARQHVFFDCSGIDVNPRLYLCTIMIDADANAVRVYDQVTGKLYIGPYDAAETIGEVFAKAVDAYHSITVSAVTLDGVTVTGQTVTIREGTDATAPVYATATITDGAPAVFVVPKGMIYFLEITDALPDHFGPRVTSGVRQGIATADAAVTFTYYDAEHIDVSEITTFAKLQEALAWFGTNEAAARNNLVGLEIPDTWTATNGTVYDNPRVVWDVRYFEDENGISHLGALMGTKYCSYNDVQFDAAEGEECDNSTETVAEADVYYYGLALGEASKTAANLTLLELSEGDALPYADYAKIYKSAIRDTTRNSLQYGYNNWRDSAYRQYLNSDAEAGQWWGATHIGDIAPSQLNSVRGFMAGCSAALLAAAKKVKVATWPNYITDGPNLITTLYETLDTFFLPSGSEVYGSVNESGGDSVEGELSPYWQARTGYTSPNNAATSTRIIYRELPVGSTANRSAAYVRLRSAIRGSSSYVWLVNTSGQVYNLYNASNALASAPACVIY